jgi:hypothetical protein
MAGPYRTEGKPDRAGLHELRQGRRGYASVDARRGRRGCVLPAGRRTGRHVLGHRECLSRWHLGGVRRPGDQQVLPPRGHRAGHQGLREDARGPRRQRPVPQGHPGAGGCLAAAAGYRLHRRLLHPPLRPRDADRGDHGRTGRPGSGRQGALPRRVVDVGLAVREDAARRRAPRVDHVRSHAGPSTTCSSGRRSAT